MKTDNVLRCEAMNLLIKGLGEVETERFIYLVKREHFDYTEWQRLFAAFSKENEVNEIT